MKLFKIQDIVWNIEIILQQNLTKKQVYYIEATCKTSELTTSCRNRHLYTKRISHNLRKALKYHRI